MDASRLQGGHRLRRRQPDLPGLGGHGQGVHGALGPGLLSQSGRLPGRLSERPALVVEARRPAPGHRLGHPAEGAARHGHRLGRFLPPRRFARGRVPDRKEALMLRKKIWPSAVLPLMALAAVAISLTIVRQARPPRPSGLLIGAKIYEHKEPFPGLFAAWRETGVNTGFVSPALISDPEFRRLAKENGVA